MKTSILTLGCKLNFAESSYIGACLAKQGIMPAAEGETPDLCIVNTCTVTDQADRKGRQLIHKLHKQYPQAQIIVTGCQAQLKADKLLAIEGVSAVFGANDKFAIVQAIKEGKIGGITLSPADKTAPYFPACSGDDRTRHFLKVQDGCDYFCTYCAIPFARGRSRSASIAQVCQMAKQVADNGGKEIILTGVNIGDFGKHNSETFADLVRALDDIEGIERFRISSIEPDLLDDDVIRFVARSKRFAPHFHLPLQSGCGETLKLMHRRYTPELFAHKVQLIKELLPDAFIGVDIIVGTRGESEEMFKESYDFASSLPVSKFHVFSYSERAGTAALRINPAVSPQEKKRRSAALLQLSEEKLDAFCKSQIGKEKTVLWEAKSQDGYMYGFTENYVKLRTAYDPDLVNKTQKLTITSENLSQEQE